MVSKAREGKFEEGTWGLEFGKAFVSVTQHMVSHTSEIDIYQPGQHNPTHPSIHIKFAYEYMQVLTTG